MARQTSSFLRKLLLNTHLPFSAALYILAFSKVSFSRAFAALILAAPHTMRFAAIHIVYCLSIC
jgi:hypothetical protein